MNESLPVDILNLELLNKILESSSDCIKVLDLDGKVLFMSDGGLTVMEVEDFGTIKGRPWLDFWKGPHQQEAAAALAEARAGRTGKFRGAAPTLRGTWRWWDVRMTGMRGPDGTPDRLLSISRDITAENEADQAVRDMNVSLERRVGEEIGGRHAAEAQVRQLQKMEAVGQLTGGIAHDFNNMLAVIIGALNLIERKLAKGEPVQTFVNGALEAASRAATLTQRLLAFSRQLPLAPEAVDANRLVGSMTDMLQRTLGEATPVETVLTGGVWKTHIDARQLESAILNLDINARDAMPDGGKLTIETSNAHLDDDYARQHGDVDAGQYVLIAVSDTGAGMSPDVITKAFDPFFTTKGIGKGTGLGLSQVHGFIKQSHVHVKIYSEVGQGTVVKLYLPRLFANAEAAAAAAAARHARPPGGTLADVVLLVEDEDRMREIATAGLRELGYTVLHASSGNAALAILRSQPR